MLHPSNPSPLLSDAPTLFISDQDICQVARWPQAIDALEKAYCQPIDLAMVPNRTMARGANGIWLRSLSAVSPSGRHMGNKLIAASPQAKSASYLMSLFDCRDMRLVALLDANQITAFRTAATTAMALRRLCTPLPQRVAMLGSGFEAKGHLHALLSLMPVEWVRVYSPSPKNRESYAREFSQAYPQLTIQPTESAVRAVEGATLVICAARSHDETPILEGQWLKPGMTVASIGSTLPEQREVDVEVIRRAQAIYADMPDEILHDTGDILAATQAGVDVAAKLHDLGRLFSMDRPMRKEASDILLFKSVGSALQDVVVAEMIYEQATRQGLGVGLPKTIVPVLKW
jgi:alanine dehydrogenase